MPVSPQRSEVGSRLTPPLRESYSGAYGRTSIDLFSTTQTVERGVPVGVEVASHGELQKVWDDVVGNYKFSTYV